MSKSTDSGREPIQQRNDLVRSWCDLPGEILSLIISHLLVGDSIAFRGVCKWWSETPSPATISIMSTEQPFLLLPSNKLFHPIYKYSHDTHVYDLPKAIIRASHCGWLLMTLYKCRIFFFNPFTKEKVELPNMNFTHYWPNMTFSSSVDLSDCLVFGVQQEPTSTEEINIYTINPGQPNWKMHTIYCKQGFQLSSCNPVFFKGLYYCLGKGGTLLIYDSKRNKDRWVTPEHSLHQNQSIFVTQYYMVESKGRLLLVFTDREGHAVNVVRMDTSKRGVWEKVNTLRETMIFVSQVTSFSSKSVIRGTGNKIYFPRFGKDNRLLCYSLTTRKYQCLDGGFPCKYFDKTKSYPNSTWIKPCHSS